MGSKAILFLGLTLAMILFISSKVAARDLAETSTKVTDQYGGGYGGGGHGGGGGYGGGGGGYGGGGRGGGGYGGGGHGGGGYGGGGHGGGGYGGGGGGYGGCRHGCCGQRYGRCQCCTYAGQKVDTETHN